VIKGIGIDLISAERFRDVKDKDDFLKQILTKKELYWISKEHRKNFFYATLFAVKEAIFKALRCGLHCGAFWHDIELTTRLEVQLSGFIKKRAQEKSVSKMYIAHSRSNDIVTTFVVLDE
jgi:phosphopantetheine--protein transferase-like protein